METGRLVRKAGKTFTTWRPWLSIKPSANLAGLLALPCRIAEFSCVPPHNEEEKTVDPDELSTTNTKLLNNYFWQMVTWVPCGPCGCKHEACDALAHTSEQAKWREASQHCGDVPRGKGPLFDRNNVPSPIFQTCCHGGGRNSSRESLNLVVGCWYHTIHTHVGVLEQAMASSFRDHSRSTLCSRIECQTKHVRNGLLLQSPQDDFVVRIDCVTLLDSHSAYQVAGSLPKYQGWRSRQQILAQLR